MEMGSKWLLPGSDGVDTASCLSLGTETLPKGRVLATAGT